MVVRYLYGLVLLSLSIVAWSQQDSIASETLVLDAIDVSDSPYARYSTSSNYRTLVPQSGQSLGDLLQNETGIYFKTYGNGQLMSIAFRGTNANHTNVLWNGVPANYPTLGQMDFSQIPLWFISSVGLQPGSAGSLYGNGAIGGAVVLNHESSIDELLKAQLSIGSFGLMEGAVSTNYGLGKWSGSTKAYKFQLKNDFDYELDGEMKTEDHASVQDRGVQQELSYQVSKSARIEGVAHFTENDREIQPSKFSTNEDELKTKNWRTALSYTQELANSSFKATLAYLRNDQLYNKSDRTVSNQLSSVVTYDRDWTSKLNTRSGFTVNRFTADADHYTRSFIDWQIDVFNALEYRVTKNWKSKLNLRYTNYEGTDAFIPAFGQELTVFKSEGHLLQANASFSAGFRYPTLNDRYWSPGGNSNLKAEKSSNLEATLRYTGHLAKWSVRPSVTVFRISADDWILWRPTSQGFWSPENLQSVVSEGIESSVKITYESNMSHSLTAHHSYTVSTDQSSEAQLPYVPFHQLNTHYSVSYKSWSTRIHANYTGRRYTTLDNTWNQSVDAFMLFNWSIGKKIALQNSQLELMLECRNIFDKSYENLINRAMPGRNFQFTLNYQ